MATKNAPVEDLTPRQPPIIPLASCTLHNTGFVWREFMVRLPEEFIAADLADPNIWSNVQSQHALRTHDRLYMVAFDESWVAECIVAQADGSKAVLAKPRITSFPERYEKLFETELYRVAWAGSGYAVIRKSDNHRMTSPVSSVQIAERDLVQLHPRVAG